MSPENAPLYQSPVQKNISFNGRGFFKTKTITFQDKSGHGKNCISNRKYTLLTFLPYHLYQILGENCNIYFLFVSFLQQLEGISPTGKYTTIVPFLIMVLVGMVKDVIVDVRQKQVDDGENNRTVYVWDSKKKSFASRPSRDLCVGNLLLLRNDVEAPADLFALAFCVEGDMKDAPCFKKQVADVFFINSATFDGESSLKIRKTVLQTPAEVHTPEPFEGMAVDVHEENSVVGLLHFRPSPESPVKHLSICKESFVARGCRLTNSRGPILGVVINTGEECLIRLSNRTSFNLKLSVFEQHTLRRILWFMIVFIFSACCISIFYFNNLNRHFKVHFGLRRRFYSFHLNENLILPLGTFFILFSVTIPVSFYLLLGLMREIYAQIMQRDKKLRSKTTNDAMTVKSPALCCDLGAVSYVFTDKTGTLTKNKLSLRGLLLIAGHMVPLDLFKKEFGTEDTFYLALVCCHSLQVLPVCGVNTIIGASTDELAILSEFLSHIDFINDHKISLKDGTVVEILDLIEFDSSQRKSTIIVRTRKENRLLLFCKGSESVIIPLCNSVQQYSAFFRAYESLSCGSYRCLVYGVKELTQSEFAVWEASQKSTEDLQKLSQSLRLLGSTLIEDELQKDVTKTIEFMKKANMKLVLISGDKDGVTIATAKKVGIVSADEKLKSLSSLINENAAELTEKTCVTLDGPAVDGLQETASNAERNEIMKKLCSSKVSSIVCYRMTPAQKSAFVGWFVAHLKQTSTVICAVGDGSNDVGMLRTAHIGVAIQSQEGADALAASDFGVYEFRHLRRLFFVHGHYNLYRFILLLVGSFYKSFLLALCHLAFQLFSSFGSLCEFEVIAYSTYNVIWSKLTILYCAILSRDVPEFTLLTKAENYWNCNYLSIFNRLFFKAIAFSFWHAFCVMLIPYLYFANSGLTELTKNDNFDVYSFLTFTSLIILVNLRIIMMTSHRFSVNGLRIISLPIALWFFYMFGYEKLASCLIFQSIVSTEALFVMLLVCLSAFLPDIFESLVRWLAGQFA